MEEALQFFKNYEIVIYVILGVLILWEVRKFILGWEEVRGAAFGLEREAAQGKLNRAAVLLVIVLIMGMAEFTLVSFVAPAVPGATPLLTPTLNILATPTVTLSPSAVGTSGAPGASEQTVDSAATPATTAAPLPMGTAVTSGCLPNQLLFSSPQNGDTISGKVTIKGTVDFPNLAFYKFEAAHPSDPIWLPIQAGEGVKRDETLGEWNTSTLPQGDYILQLVALNGASQILGACQIQIRIAAEPAKP